MDFGIGNQDTVPDMLNQSVPFSAAAAQPSLGGLNANNHIGFDGDETFTWEMIGQGVDEPLPCQEVVDELYVDFQRTVLCDTYVVTGIISTLRNCTHQYR